MLNSKEFAEALKQRYSDTKAVKNIKHSKTSVDEEDTKKKQEQTNQLDKLKFLRSKKARSGLPSKIRAKMYKSIEESTKRTDK